jgi:hypothetical protein
MNTFWLKLAAVVIAGAAIFIFMKKYSHTGNETKPQEKTFYDAVAEDEARLRAEPEYKSTEEKQENTTELQKTKETAERDRPLFRELSENEDIEAQRLFEVAIKARSMGRLQTGFKLMVDTCRQIIEKFPDSEYAFKAKRMLADMPERYRARYKITEEEIDLGGME